MIEVVKNIDEILSENIRTRRKALGLTQEEFAERAGISTPSLQSIETKRSWPSRETLAQLAKALGLPSPALFRTDLTALDEYQAHLKHVQKVEDAHKDPDQVESAVKADLSEMHQILKNLNYAAEVESHPSGLMRIISKFTQLCVEFAGYLKERDSEKYGNSNISSELIDRLRNLDEYEIRSIIGFLDAQEMGKREAHAEMLAENEALNRKNRKKG